MMNEKMKSESLLKRLETADRSWRRGRAIELGLRIVPLLCAALILIVAVDLIFHLGGGLRFTLGLSFLAAFLGLVGWLGYRALLKKGSLLPVARLLEDRDPTIGSKLINVLQLEETALDESAPKMTRKLARRAIDESSGDLEGRDFRGMTESQTWKRSAIVASVPVLVLIVAGLVFSQVARTEWLRFIDPFGDHPAFSFTQLQILDPTEEGTRVIYRESAFVEAAWSGHRPKEIFLTIENEDPEIDPVTIPMFPRGDDRYVQDIESVEGNLTIRAHNRSRRALSPARQISVILNPEVEAATVSILPPAYTGIAEKKRDLDLGPGKSPTVNALIGSQVSFLLQSNRPLSDGSIGVRSSDPEQTETRLAPGTGEAENTVTAVIEATESGRLIFDLRDISGLPAAHELAANLVVTHDLPPKVEITEPRSDGFIVEDFETTISFRAEDDYGIHQLRIHSAINNDFSEPRVTPGDDEAPVREIREELKITPRKMGAKAGDTLSFFADVTDTRPDAQLARSRTLKLEVITEEAYNEYLRLQTEIRDLENKYATFHDEVRRLAEEQRELAREAAAAKAEGVEEGERDELAEKQSELNQALEDLANRMENATRENPLYDIEKDLQKVLNEEAKAIRESIAMNESELSEFRESSPSDSAVDEFGKDAEAQADRLDPAREQAEQKIAEAIEDSAKMQDLLKALNAYRRLYAAQEQLANQSAAFVDKAEMTREDRLALQQMAGVERDISVGLEEIVKALLEGADNAEDLYPQAADDARKIADQIRAANLSSLADASSRTMQNGRGPQSHQQAEHLRAEMEKLMSECQACQGGGEGEFEQRLSLMRGMAAGNTYSQMAQCQNFGFGQSQGLSMGSGSGMGGMMGMGQAMPGQQSRSLLGGESMLGRREGANAEGKQDVNPTDLDDENLVVKRPGDGGGQGATRATRPSESSVGDLFSDEYRDLVEAYFRKLTTGGTEP